MDPLGPQDHQVDPMHSSNSNNTNSKLWKFLFFILLVLFLLFLCSVISYYFYSKKPSNIVLDSGIQSTSPSVPTDSGIVRKEMTFEEAQEKVLKAVKDLSSHSYIQYLASGSDGDEISFEESYSVDLVNRKVRAEISEKLVYSDDTLEYSLYRDGDTYYKTKYDRVSGKYGERQVETDTEFRNNIQNIIESTEIYLMADKTTNTIEVSTTTGMYEDSEAEFITISFKQAEDVSFFDRFRVFADVVLDEYSIEAVVAKDGRLLELKLPFVYNSVTYRFISYDEPFDIDNP